MSMNKSTAITVVTSSPSSTAPKVSSTINPPTTRSTAITNFNTLGPGTLILANGNVVRILPQPPHIIVKPPSNNLVIHTTTTSIFTKSFAYMRSPHRAITKTTQINKVPIPSLIPHSIISRRKTKPVKRKLQKTSTKARVKRIKRTEKVVKGSTESPKNSSKNKTEVKACEKETENKSPEQPQVNNEVNELLEAVSEIKTPDKIDEIVNSVVVSEAVAEVVVSIESQVTESVNNEPEIKGIADIAEDKPKQPEDNIELGMNLNSELSNDIFSSLNVPIGGQNPESTSPTAAFLLAFPLVSSLTGVKVTEVIEEENSSSHNGTPTLLQIGTMDTTKTTQSESVTPNLLNLDNFSFFSGYSSFDYSGTITTSVNTLQKVPITLSKICSNEETSVKTHFSCAQDNTSVTYSTVGSVSTPFVQCENRNLQNPMHNQDRYNTIKDSEHKHTINPPKPYVATTVQCNTFNTFQDFSKPSNTYSMNFTKSYSDPVYTSNNHYNYTQNNYNNNQYYSTKQNTNTTTYQRCNYYNPTKTTQAKEKFSPPKNKNQPKAPINWMTSPDFRGTASEYIAPPIPSFSKDLEYNPTNAFYPPPVVTTHTNYFNNTNSHEFQQNVQFEENQFSWSPSKLPQYVEAPHGFVATTLPTLVGDLALGTIQANTEQVPKAKERNKQRVNPNNNYDTSSANFLSVSQLVEHKADRGSNRRAGRNIKTNHKMKKVPEPTKDLTESDKKPAYPNWMEGCTSKQIRHGNKNSQSSYSAEALIGHPDLNENLGNRQRYRQNFAAPPNKTLPIPAYLSDNIVPSYFPPVEITQENYMPTNQNYQNFTQNASTYLPDFSTSHDYTNISNRPNNDCSLKKPKHKSTNENLSMDFGFLSVSGAINSPILPDDFHAHTNFIPTPAPNQLYSCKNPLYPKQSSDLLSLPPVPGSRNTTQQFENVPGSSLTNFNLSAIFPEMNKGSAMYPSEPTRNKNYNFHYLASTTQTTFHNKSTPASSSYISTTATPFTPTN